MKSNKNNQLPGDKVLEFSVPWRLYGFISLIGFILVAVMGFGFYLGNHMVLKYAPLVDAAMEIKYEAASAHLGLEEILSGDRTDDVTDVHQHLDEALWYCNAMLNGGENAEGIYIPIKKPGLRDEIEKMIVKLKLIYNLTDQRFEARKSPQIQSSIDQRYDALYGNFIKQADTVETKLQTSLAIDYHSFQIVHAALLTMSIILIGIILWMFSRFERGRAHHMHLLSKTNQKLQQAFDEIKLLRGIIPICSYCKNIRDDKGLWKRLEAYLHEHSDAEFTHCVCPDCYKKQIDELKSMEK